MAGQKPLILLPILTYITFDSRAITGLFFGHNLTFEDAATAFGMAIGRIPCYQVSQVANDYSLEFKPVTRIEEFSAALKISALKKIVKRVFDPLDWKTD